MRSVSVVLLSLMFLTSVISIPESEPIVFARYPAIYEETLVFSYLGDLWRVNINGGRAERLTVHTAYDYRPVFSPSGREIAFSSTRYGDSDIFVMPLDGGEPMRMTYFSNFDRVTDWSEEGIIFYSYRTPEIPELPSIYSVKNNETPQKLVTGFEGKLSPDGKVLAFVRGEPSRRGYTGSANEDIWLYFLDEDRYQRVTDSMANDCYPMWLDSSTLCYVSGEGGVANLWRTNIDGAEQEKLTSFEEDGVRYAYLNEGRIVYEQGKDIRTLDLNSGEDRVVEIFAPSDIKSTTSGKVTGGISEIALSPNGGELAFVVLGEIFVMDLSNGEMQRITNSSSINQQLSWAPDGKELLFCSNRYGNYDIFSVRADEPLSKALKREIKRLTDSEKNEYSPSFSPDGKMIAYGSDGLWVMGVNGKGKRELSDSRDLFYTLEHSWSPDSKSIALTKLDNRENGDIFTVSLDGEEKAIVKDPHNSYSPVWTDNGIYFVSTRADISYSRLASSDIWLVGAEDEPERLTFFEGNESTIAVSGSAIAFAGESGGEEGLWIMWPNGEGAQELIPGEVWDIEISKQGTEIYFIDSQGMVYSVNLMSGETSLVLPGVEMWLDMKALREEVFDELWLMVNDFFYDRTFGGKDWKAIKEKYSFAKELESDDFYDCMNLMLDELGVSHLGIREPVWGLRKSGLLGVTLDGSRVESVMKSSPADEAGIKVGDTIKAINGVKVDGININMLLDDKAGERILVELGNREVELTPVSYSEAMDIAYENWEEENRELVEELSNGKVGYVCIKNMDINDLAKFQREIYSIGEGKDALIIDVRNNPGGWIADYLLVMLAPQSYGYTVGRHGESAQQFDPPFYVWDKDVVVLCNQYSYSDAEVFCHAMKGFDRGKIVGVETAGGVLSALGIPLIDGSILQLPVEAVYTSKGLKMEGNGCIPHIKIENEPGGKDRQLEAAVRIAKGY